MHDVFELIYRRSAFLMTKIKTLWLQLYARLICHTKSGRKTYYKTQRAKIERKYLSRYLYALNTVPTETSQHPVPKIIWTCWWQGEENMPPVVKRCIASMRRHCPDYELRIITADNMQNYIELPDYVMQKYKKGRITRTQLSDLLRVALLTCYGGMWMDATVYLTAPLPATITDAPFFAFHGHEIYQSQSWFLRAADNDKIINCLKNLMFAYWKHENKMINYFLVYLAYDVVVTANPQCAKQWEQTPLIYDDCYELADNYFAPYTPQKWAQIKAKTTIHKLSWKYTKQPAENSFLDYLLNGKLED